MTEPVHLYTVDRKLAPYSPLVTADLPQAPWPGSMAPGPEFPVDRIEMDWLRHGLCHDDAIKWVAVVQRQVGDHVFGVPIVKAIRNVPLTFQTSLFQYSVECPWREVIGWLSGDCNSSESAACLDWR